MSRQRRRDTGPELALRRALHSLGLRFRVHPEQLPGRPDVVLTRAKVAIFVDGCFWHRCPDHCVAPKANSDWWRTKLQSNVDRDRRVDEALENLGWAVLRVWEHESPLSAAERIAALRARRLAGAR